MRDIVYLAAGLRVILLVAVPTTLVVCTCAAIGAALQKWQETDKKQRKSSSASLLPKAAKATKAPKDKTAKKERPRKALSRLL